MVHVTLNHRMSLEENLTLQVILYFSWINFIPLNGKGIIKNNYSSANLLLLNHHLFKNNNLMRLN